jgi:His-Xaa-Ser system radical SAM maturase HxsC
MLKLHGKVIDVKDTRDYSGIYSISTNLNLPSILRATKIFFITSENIPEGYFHYLVTESQTKLLKNLPSEAAYTILSDDFYYINDKDIVRLSNDKQSIHVIFRAQSKHNSFLVTEQCNHYCLMCSQPPKNIDDSHLFKDLYKVIPLIPKDTEGIGFTGGEPTLFGDQFLDLLNLTKSNLPNTSVHILSNGRAFSNFNYAKKYAEIEHPDMMVGIPIYSDDSKVHNYIVQAEDAFDQTIQGILNLKKLKQPVEIRVVLHKQSIPRLVELCRFITRNLLFIDHVALMGLEIMGFTRANLDQLWIDQFEYKDTLSKAVNILVEYGMTVSIYNHQLCLINDDISSYCVKSISDWKNEYAVECSDCLRKSECGGFFSSGIKYKYSDNLKPFLK